MNRISLSSRNISLLLPIDSMRDPLRCALRTRLDLDDLKDDVQFLSSHKQPSLAFGWYQEGYGTEPPVSVNDDPTDAGGLHASYITHHNGPQYFGYIANNPEMRKDLRSLRSFFRAVHNGTLTQRGQSGGAFFIKGGSWNTLGLRPSDPDPTVEKKFLGDDDHPAYSDAQISEAMVATVINKIVRSKYWKDCAIIITWDDSEGDYDHVLPPITVWGPDGSPISDGPRVPLILISPYARTDYIAQKPGNHASVVKFIDTVFQLTPLATLPDEGAARKTGEQRYGQSNLGPQDAITKNVSDLLEAFDPDRLRGVKAPLSTDYTFIPWKLVQQLPAGYGCDALGIHTTDRTKNILDEIPKDFNPRPKTDPGE